MVEVRGDATLRSGVWRAHACVVADGREKEVRCATWDAVGEVTAKGGKRERDSLARLGEREGGAQVIEGDVPVSTAAGRFPIESKGSCRYGGFSPAVGGVPGRRE